MTKPQIRVEGVGPLVRALQQSGNVEVLEALKKANAEAAGTVHATAAGLIPVQTGRLARTLRGSATARAGTIRAGRKGLPYAGVIHFGWPKRNIEPQPFLYDALDRRRSEVYAAYAASVRGLVRDFNRRAGTS